MVGATFSDRYVLGEKVAAGGMGTVYVATDTRLQRRVALKLMKGELAADPRFVERFRREARSAGSLSHPNVAGVFDYGQDGDKHYIVMEYIEGRDLARLLREDGPLDETRAAAIAAQIASALGHAHAAGVVHRDVKPANVIVQPGDRVKVTDFGIARAHADTALTATGSLLGTAQYISPEQASGAEIGPPSDVYSLGIVLFEMLTGSVPFTGDSAVAVAMRHISDRVPAPSSLSDDVSPAMDELVLTATAPEPHERFPDAAAFADALTSPGPTTPVPTQAATSVLGSSPTQTAVLGGTATTSPVDEGWPFPGHPPTWNPNTLGKIVLGVFLALLLLAAALVVYRLVESDPGRPSQARRDAGAAAGGTQVEEQPVEEPATIEVPPLVDVPYDEAAAELDSLGLAVARVDSPNDDYETGIVYESAPAAGTEVSEGDTVTLYVSTGPAEETSDGDEFVPPGQAKKDKSKEEDD